LRITHQTLLNNWTLTTTNPISYVVTPFLSGSENLTYPTGDLVQIVSPDSRSWSGAQENQSFEGELVIIAMNEILETYMINLRPESYLLAIGFFVWQYEQLAEQIGFPDYLDVPDMDSWQRPASVSGNSWKPLEELWIDDDSAIQEADALQLYIYSRMVIGFIIESYGTDKAPLIFRALGTTDSMADWVQTVTGQPLDQFEAEWRAWVLSN